MDSQVSAAGMLLRYMQLYWLKPFDAINDTANAWALRQFRWDEPILEIGGGDGAFSFIMHGGEFAFEDDRYDQSDPGRTGNIFDVYQEGKAMTVRRPADRQYEAGIDPRATHLRKSKETGMYRSLSCSVPHKLPFPARSFKTVFLYFPHGLDEHGTTMDYEAILPEIRRVLRPDGVLLMTAFNRRVAGSFVCEPLARLFESRGWTRLAAYFKKLDAGRYREIAGMSRPAQEWPRILEQSGFRLQQGWSQVSPWAWRVYDVQTRPILRAIIRGNWMLKHLGLKKAVKALWVLIWYPPLALFYRLFAKPRRFSPDSAGGVFFAFRAVPILNAAI